MKHYAIAEMDVTDPAWVRDYLTQVTPMVERRGGRYLARTGAAETIEGDRDPSQVMMIIEWPSRQAADEFYESEEYRPHREARMAGARNQFFLVAGEDATGAASV
jgi:uncharacterized protein (DUF1330 family)